jgi:hypothetical protein
VAYEDDLALARDRVVGCEMRSRQHRASWKRWHRRAVTLQIALAALSAIAGSALLAGAAEGSPAAIAIGLAAIAGAILTAATDAISPANTAEAHRRAAIRFSALGVGFNTFVRTSRDDEQASEQFATLEKEHLDAVREGPEPEQWAVSRTRADSG